jgi:hypothetical protein
MGGFDPTFARHSAEKREIRGEKARLLTFEVFKTSKVFSRKKDLLVKFTATKKPEKCPVIILKSF